MTPQQHLVKDSKHFTALVASGVLSIHHMRSYLETMLDVYERELARRELDAERLATPTGT